MIVWSQEVSSTSKIWSLIFRYQLYRRGRVGFQSPLNFLSTLVQPFWFGRIVDTATVQWTDGATIPAGRFQRLPIVIFIMYWTCQGNFNWTLETFAKGNFYEGVKFVTWTGPHPSRSLVWDSQHHYLIFNSHLNFGSWKMTIKLTSILACWFGILVVDN